MTHNPGGKSRPPWPTDSKVTSVFSECERYRYKLSEIWEPGKPLVLWVLMNPSVACLDFSDPTLRKTGKYSRRWGYGGQLIGNVHAYRSTDKARLLEVDDPIGPYNDDYIKQMAEQAEMVVLAFGQPPKKLANRGREVIGYLNKHPKLTYLMLAKDGVTPVHPLYLSADTIPKAYSQRHCC